LGTLLLALTLAAYALAMTTGRGSFGMLNVALLFTAVFGVGLFVLAEAKTASPLIRLAMLRNPLLSAGWEPEVEHGLLSRRWAENWTGIRAAGYAPPFKAMPLGGERTTAPGLRRDSIRNSFHWPCAPEANAIKITSVPAQRSA
jgi:hypothetical protein